MPASSNSSWLTLNQAQTCLKKFVRGVASTSSSPATHCKSFFTNANEAGVEDKSVGKENSCLLFLLVPELDGSHIAIKRTCLDSSNKMLAEMILN